MTDPTATAPAGSHTFAPTPATKVPGRPTGGALVARVVIGFAIAAVAIELPQYYGQTTTKLVAQGLYLAVAAMGLNLLTGYNGQVSIGHGAFFGIGSYISALLMVHQHMSFYVTLPIVAVGSFVLGALFGFPALRVKGLYLALVTLGLAALVPTIVTRFVHESGNTTLTQPPIVTTPGFVPFSVVPRNSDDIWRYYVVLLTVVVLLVLASNLVRSRIGRAMIAIREREVAAESIGVNVAKVKVLTFAISTAYAGVAGALSVLIDGVAQTGSVLYFQNSILFLVAVVIGGAATIAGPVVGALIVVFLQDRTKTISQGVLSPALFGGVLILMMYVLPDGAVGGLRRLGRRLRRGRGAPAPVPTPIDPSPPDPLKGPHP